jgi:hypothetical protein
MFMNREVKTPLGVKVNSNYNIATPKSGVSSGSGSQTPINPGILGGFGNMLGGLGIFSNKQNPNTLNNTNEKPKSGFATNLVSNTGSKESSRTMSMAYGSESPTPVNFDTKYDLSPIQNEDFDYTNPQDIRNLLNKFLKSNFPTEKLTAFIKEVCGEYSELLFYAHKSLNEIRELEIVKDALNERYKKYYKYSTQLQNDVNDLKKLRGDLTNYSDNNSNISITDTKYTKEIENKYFNSQIEINKLKEQIERNEKKLSYVKDRESQIYSEYESFKLIFMKEIRNLRFDLDETIKQRNTMRNALIESKSYFNNIISNQLANSSVAASLN